MSEAGQGDCFQPRALAEDLDVDERGRPERQPHRIAAHLGVRPELATERRER